MTAHSLTDAVNLDLAGHRFALQPAVGAPPIQLPPVYSQFLSSEPTAALVSHLEVTAPDPRHLPAVDPARIVWQSDHWCLATCDATDGQEASSAFDYLLAIHALPDERRITVARVAHDFSCGTLVPIAGRHGAAAPYSFNYPCDQVLVLNRLLHFGVGVVHAGGVAFEGQGLLFCGRSGAGKTTLSRLCRDQGALLLNDDRQFIWPAAHGALLAPTPWHGLEPAIRNTTVPLRAIFHLVQATSNRITPLREIDAAARLLGNTVAPFYFPKSMERMLELWDQLVSHVPSYLLEFTPDVAAVNTVRKSAGL